MGLPLIFSGASPLSYPGLTPAFDPSHIAMSAGGTCRFSGVATPDGNFRNLLSGAPGTVGGTITHGIDAFGPFAKFAQPAHSNFAGQPTTNDKKITGAFVCRVVSNSSVYIAFANSSATSTGLQFGLSSNQPCLNQPPSSPVAFGPTLTVGHAYFVAISAILVSTTWTINYAVADLSAGTILSGSTTTSSLGSPNAPNGTFIVGNASNNSNGFNARLGAVASLATFLSVSSLVQWAQRPWDFWYPPTVENLIFTALAAPSAAAPAYTFTQPLIGSQQPPPLDHPQSTLLIGVGGPNVKTPDIEDSVLVLQEAPFHPASRFGAGVQGPNVGALPQVGTLVLRQFYPLDHPLPRFIAGVQGPNVESAVTSAIVIRREEIDYPRHPVSFFYPGRQGPNVASPEQIGRLVVGQFVPLDHPASLFYPGRQGPNVRPPVSDTILQLLELPWHPASFVRGQPPITLIFVPPVRGTIVQALEMPLAHPLGMFFPGPPGPNVTPSVNNTDYILRARRRKRR